MLPLKGFWLHPLWQERLVYWLGGAERADAERVVAISNAAGAAWIVYWRSASWFDGAAGLSAAAAERVAAERVLATLAAAAVKLDIRGGLRL